MLVHDSMMRGGVNQMPRLEQNRLRKCHSETRGTGFETESADSGNYRDSEATIQELLELFQLGHLINPTSHHAVMHKHLSRSI